MNIGLVKGKHLENSVKNELKRINDFGKQSQLLFNEAQSTVIKFKTSKNSL